MTLSHARFQHLLETRYKSLNQDHLDDQIFTLAIALLEPLECIWCRYDRIAGELLRLFSYPESELSKWFDRKNAESLSSCVACMEKYYLIRAILKDDFTNLFLDEALSLELWRRVQAHDVQRLSKNLQDFLSGRIDHRSTILIHTLYELLLYPRTYNDNHLYELFVDVVRTLVNNKKMILISKVLPGLITNFLDEASPLRNWSTLILKKNNHLEKGAFPDDAIDIDITLAKVNVDDYEEFQRLSLLLYQTECIPPYFMRAFIGRLQKSRHFGIFEPGILSKVLNLRCLDQGSFRKIIDGTLNSTSDIQSINELAKYFLDAGETTAVEYLLCKLQYLDKLNINLSHNLQTFFSFPMIQFCIHNMETSFQKAINRLLLLASSDDVGSREDLLIFLLKADIALSGWIFKDQRTLLVNPLESLAITDKVILNVLFEDNIETDALLSYLFRWKEVAQSCYRAIFSERKRLSLVKPIFLLFLPLVIGEKQHVLLLKEYYLSHPELAIDAMASFTIKLQSIIPDLSHFYLGFVNIINECFMDVFFTRKDGFSGTIIDLFPNKEELSRTLSTSLITLSLIPFLNNSSQEWQITAWKAALGILSTLYRLDLVFYGQVQVEKRDLLEATAVIISTFLKVCNIANEIKAQSLIVIFEIATFNTVAFNREILKSLDAVLLDLKGLNETIGHKLDNVIEKYEKRTRIICPRLFKPQKQPPTKLSKSKLDVDPELEMVILEDIQSAASRHKERTLPISLRSNNIPLISKTSSKLDQLRAEVAQEYPSVPFRHYKPVSEMRKRVIKLSSASESEDWDDTITLKSKLSATNFKQSSATNLKQSSATDSSYSSRSVKMIDFEEQCEQRPPKTLGSSYVPDEISLLKRFHRIILNFCLSSEQQNPEFLSPVPLTFSSIQEYISVFEPLLFTECHAQLLANFEEAIKEPLESIKINLVTHADDFHEVQVGEDIEVGKRSDRLVEHDYLLVYLGSAPPVPAVVAHRFSKGITWEAVVRLFLKDEEKYPLQLELREGLQFKYRYLGSVVTNFREFVALHVFPTVDMADLLLKPNLPPLAGDDNLDMAASRLAESIKINKSQAKAVIAVTENRSPIVLVQGPPGTGKTRTIEALLGLLLVRPRNLKILVCAPSNAAIDEIVRRIRYGLYNAHGLKFTARVLRIGTLDMIADDVKDLTIDSQVDHKMKLSIFSSSNLLEEQRKNCDNLRRSVNELEKLGNPGEKLKSMKTALWEAKESMRKNLKYIEDTRMNLRQKILEEAQIVCCTLSSSGHDLISRISFGTVVIDEACQAVELSCLVPLRHNAKKLVLVGDPNQLPPTVVSQVAEVFSYEQSLFVRLQKTCPQSILLLDTQYRMHPEISRFPNSYFYEGRLVDGPSMAKDTWRPWHAHQLLGPFKFIDVQGKELSLASHSGVDSKSKMNEAEAQVAANLVALICSIAKQSMVNKIGIVTPYKDQKKILRKTLQNRYGHSVVQALEISTVDGFQGQEREVIIFSCVRTGEGKGIGFLNDTRRLNVALTRAQCSLFVLGKAQSLGRNPIWRALIEDAKSRGCYVKNDSQLWRAVEGKRTLDNFKVSKELLGKDNSDRPADTPSIIKTPAQRRMELQNANSNVRVNQSIRLRSVTSAGSNPKNINSKPKLLTSSPTKVSAHTKPALKNTTTRLLIDELLDRDPIN